MPALPRVVDGRVHVVTDTDLAEVFQEAVDRHPTDDKDAVIHGPHTEATTIKLLNCILK